MMLFFSESLEVVCDLCCINGLKRFSCKRWVVIPLGTVVTKKSVLLENSRGDPVLFLKIYFLCMIKSLFHLLQFVVT